MASDPNDLEIRTLEISARLTTHEEVCSERYKNLEFRLVALKETVNTKMEGLEETIDAKITNVTDSNTELKKWIFWGVTAILTGLGGAVVTLLSSNV